MKILAFETSCDETAAAVVEDGKKVLSNIISTQIDIHKEYGGVVPEIASRHHIENILPVFEEALRKAECTLADIDYIAVTNTPGLIGSLLVGLMFAKSVGYANNIPLIPVNHIEGHIFSNFIDNDVRLPAISLIVSGGHTDLYYIRESGGKINIELIGETLDDAVGETYDKIARALGLSYPGGPEIDRLSVKGEDTLKIRKPEVQGYDFSFSGVKTCITNYINNQKMKKLEFRKEDVANSLQTAIGEILYAKVLKALNEKEAETLMIAGGVSANRYLREKFLELRKERKIDVLFPKIEYCTDNAAMIGCAAYYNLKNEAEDYNFDAISTKMKK